MYQINPNSAMTELYGVGKGEAQVFDNTQAERGIQTGIKLREQRRQEEVAKAKEKKKAFEDLSAKNIGQVHPSDISGFNDMTNKYRQEVYNAYLKGGGEISIDDQLALGQKFNEINQLALNSKARFDQEKSLLANIENSKEPYRDRELAKAYEQAARPSYDSKSGKWDFASIRGINPIYDLDKQVEEAAKERRSYVDANERYGRTTWTPKQAGEDAVNVIKNNPLAGKELIERLRELPDDEFKSYINKVYNSPQDEFGNPNQSYKGKVDISKITPENINLEDVAKYQYANRFMISGQKWAPSFYAPGGGMQKGMTDIVYDPNEGTLDFNPPDYKKDLPHDLTIKGKIVRFKSPRATLDVDGNITGVTYTKLPTERQQQDNQAYIFAQKELMNKELEYVRDVKKQDEIIKKYQDKIADVPYKEEIITSKNPDDADLMIKEAYNLSPSEVMKTRGAGHNFQQVEATQPKNIEGVIYNTFNEYYEKNKNRAPKETLRAEWNKGVQFNRTGSESKKQKSDSLGVPKANTQQEFDVQWKGLKSGQKLIGPDGKIYIKK